MSFEQLDSRIVDALRVRGITSPTPPQREAIPHVLEGENILLVAPTGIGKTEAAMLPIFHMLLSTPGKGIKCLFITPLRALNRDMLRRLKEFGGGLGLKVAVRHGDTSQGERNRQSRDPPDVLITTPETLQILFTGSRLREHISRVQWVVIDEIHELAPDERGAQLAVALERLVELAGEFQRIGLSATVGSIDEVARYLVGARDVQVARHDVEKEMALRVESPEQTEEDRELAGTLQGDADLMAAMRRTRELIASHRSSLLFVNTRDTAEALAARYHLWDETFPIGVHHGSLSKEVRVEMEDAFKAERLKALICTSSLELGIDVGATDLAMQYNSPRQVSRLIQRMGRAGHSVGGRTEGAIIATDPDEVAESLVVTRRALAKELEPLRVRSAPLTVLANQLVSMSMTEAESADHAFGVVRRAYPFRDLDRETFDSVLDQLAQIRLVFVDGDSFRRSRRGMKYFYDNISMIPDERTFLIRDVGTRKVVGTLDESFVASFAEPYATFITRGRSWRILEVREDELLVERVSEIGSIPSWTGEDIPVPFKVAMEVGRLRRVRDYERYHGDRGAMGRLGSYLEEQDGPMPDDRTVTLELGDKLAILNACFGSKVNETLAKLISVLLTARLGESVGVTTDPYRIILELPRNLDRGTILETVRSIRSDSVDGLVRLMVRNSAYLRWRFVYVAKKFGVVERDADYRAVRFSRLFEAYQDSPLYREAVDKVMWEDLDLNNTKYVLRRMEEGRISLEVGKVSNIGRAGLRHSKELIQPKRADHSILMAMRKRLEDEVMHLSCLSCLNQWRVRAGDSPSRISCPRCGARMVAALQGYNRDAIRLLGKRELSEEERKEAKRLSRNANLVMEHGDRAVLTLAGRGIGPDTAARILRGLCEDDDEFLRDILSAEIHYARTKRFWD